MNSEQILQAAEQVANELNRRFPMAKLLPSVIPNAGNQDSMVRLLISDNAKLKAEKLYVIGTFYTDDRKSRGTNIIRTFREAFTRCVTAFLNSD